MKTMKTEGVRVKKTDIFDANIRQETIPEITEDQYTALLSGDEIDVAGITGEYLIKYRYVEVTNGV